MLINVIFVRQTDRKTERQTANYMNKFNYTQCHKVVLTAVVIYVFNHFQLHYFLFSLLYYSKLQNYNNEGAKNTNSFCHTYRDHFNPFVAVHLDLILLLPCTCGNGLCWLLYLQKVNRCNAYMPVPKGIEKIRRNF